MPPQFNFVHELRCSVRHAVTIAEDVRWGDPFLAPLFARPPSGTRRFRVPTLRAASLAIPRCLEISPGHNPGRLSRPETRVGNEISAGESIAPPRRCPAGSCLTVCPAPPLAAPTWDCGSTSPVPWVAIRRAHGRNVLPRTPPRGSAHRNAPEDWSAGGFVPAQTTAVIAREVRHGEN